MEIYIGVICHYQWDGTLPPEFVEFMDRYFRREDV